MNFKLKEKLIDPFINEILKRRNKLSFFKIRNVIISLSILIISIIVFFSVILFDRNTAYIYSISPEVEMPGELLTIRGFFFGKERGTSSVYFSDIKVPSSAYQKWSRSEIILRIPEEVSFGEVRIQNSYGFSNGKLFTGQKAIPKVEGSVVALNIPPVVEIVEPKEVFVSQVLEIKGQGFGEKGAVERLIFSSSDSRYERVLHSSQTLEWSPQLIRVKMIEGFWGDLTLRVKTHYGLSEPFALTMDSDSLQLVMGDEMEFQGEWRASITYNGNDSSRVCFVFPEPLNNERQALQWVKGGESIPLENRHFYFIQETIEEEDSFSAIVSLRTKLRAISYKVKEEKYAKDLNAVGKPLTQLPPLFRSAAKEFQEGKISLGGYLSTLLTLIDEQFTYEEEPKPESGSFLESRKGNAFDFSQLLVRLLTGVGVQAREVYGFYVKEGQCIDHVWIEFFYPGFGMVSLDPSGVKRGFLPEKSAAERVWQGISSHYLLFSNKKVNLPGGFVGGFFVSGEEGVLAQQNFFVELSQENKNYTIDPPQLVSIKIH